MDAVVLVLALAQATAAPAPQAATPVPAGPVVALDVVQGRTSLGTITLELDRDKAPITVDNFLQYVRSGHYDGTIFHRVIPDFMIQGGGFTPQMEEKPAGPPIRNEARNGLRNSRGTIAMARTNDPDSATCQFFINLKNNHTLDFGIGGAGYTVFGRVIDGMAVVDRIAGMPTTSRGRYENVPQFPIVIKKAREVKPAATAPKAAAPPKP
jgi:cyclophilin family peptidyl-prolyl cis-trans isomerase